MHLKLLTSNHVTHAKKSLAGKFLTNRNQMKSKQGKETNT